MKRLNPISDASNKQLSIDTKEAEESSLIALVTKFAALKNAIEDLEVEMAPVKANLTKVVAGMGGKLEIGEFRLNVADVTRENFNLKAACEKLDRRVLRPFISETKYQALRLTRKV